jgi:hypothetical protein
VDNIPGVVVGFILFSGFFFPPMWAVGAIIALLVLGGVFTEEDE